MWKNLYQSFDELSHLSNTRYTEALSSYIDQFTAVTSKQHTTLQDMADVLLGLKRTIRLYKLSLDGEQCFSNINSDTIVIPTKDRLSALADAQGASWKRREYYYNAVNNPGYIQSTKPYFSIADGILCITLSVQVKIKNTEYIVCCDVLWEDSSY